MKVDDLTTCVSPPLETDLSTGLRAELRSNYDNGECIQTTCVHPSWHSTGIVKPYEEKLAKAGIMCDPASNVSDAVVEQVLAARSGQIFMPRSEEGNTRMRNMPLWMQDIMLHMLRKRVGLDFSREN